MSNKLLFIISAFNNPIEINNSISILSNLDFNDILVVDDGSSIDLLNTIEDGESIKFIKHDENLGFGAVFMSGIKYARDFSYDYAVLLNPNFREVNKDIPQIVDNINYGFDIISASRVLENYDLVDIKNDKTEIISIIAENLRKITSFDLTDPFSELIAVKIQSMEHMDFSEFDHGLFIQLWIQAAYFGLSYIEFPAQSEVENHFEELENYEDPLGYFLSLIESENFLYQKGQIN